MEKNGGWGAGERRNSTNNWNISTVLIHHFIMKKKTKKGHSE